MATTRGGVTGRRGLLASGLGGLAAAALPGHAARARAPLQPDTVAQAVAAAHRHFAGLREGKNADYIPYLASVPSDLYGVVAVAPDGGVAKAGDVGYAFSIQSICKVFNMALVLESIGPEALLRRVGSEATGLPFNSVMALEMHRGKPQNPLVNAGAIATVSLVPAASTEERWSRILGNMSRCAGRQLDVNDQVYHSEMDTNQRNRGIAWLLRAREFLEGDPDATVDLYTRACSVAVTTQDLGMMMGTLVRGGVNPATGERVFKTENVPRILSVMATAGLYDSTGSWMFRVGVPAKSGVGGGIIAGMPGRLALAAFSPPLDDFGNSVRAQAAIGEIAAATALNLFED
ncbi:glutaminase A [Roseomonas sp. NAR14]|uniref:Glutaminase n=1 Tax=Roseomonas acroporae TaxID=2937791 RepID=A0A9X2BTU8_9PROT|nr:glutaminase A [Roseomonas acroporae]MCK8784707.1 glutaminase A [Roseomonas acroporae]